MRLNKTWCPLRARTVAGVTLTAKRITDGSGWLIHEPGKPRTRVTGRIGDAVERLRAMAEGYGGLVALERRHPLLSWEPYRGQRRKAVVA